MQDDVRYSVKQARLLSGLKQQDMADRLQIHVQTYRKIESNSEIATIAQAVRIAEITGVALDQIFFGTDSTLSRINEQEVS